MKDIQERKTYNHAYDTVFNACKMAVSNLGYRGIESRVNYIYATKHIVFGCVKFTLTLYLMKRSESQTEVCMILEYNIFFSSPDDIINKAFSEISALLGESSETKYLHKRRYIRIPAIVLCDLFTSGAELLEGRSCIINYSSGGVALETTLDIPAKTEILLQLKNNSEELNIPGRIMHRRQVMEDLYVYGIKFIGMNIFKRHKIKKELSKWKKSLLTEMRRS